jgi:hypothetical protein
MRELLLEVIYLILKSNCEGTPGSTHLVGRWCAYCRPHRIVLSLSNSLLAVTSTSALRQLR